MHNVKSQNTVTEMTAKVDFDPVLWSSLVSKISFPSVETPGSPRVLVRYCLNGIMMTKISGMELIKFVLVCKWLELYTLFIGV